ncbi:hypothetical protein HK100_012495 [Physocladia obscura]|uniref:VOC domain-containing protein n=1 Tax=Physocladia obscura TaxID=109957 RepID=A0AAD5XFV8_9FUNG|nr:hypothetical protein HK100_012495 [Physocladia obscura]
MDVSDEKIFNERNSNTMELLVGQEYFVPAFKPLKQTSDFYTSILGFRPTLELDNHVILIHDLSNSKFHITSVEPGDFNKGREAPQILFKLVDIDAVKASVETTFPAWIHPAVVERGGGIRNTEWGTREWECRDPQTNVCISFYQQDGEIQPPQNRTQINSGVIVAGQEFILPAIGSLKLLEKTPHSSVAFYTTILGYKVTSAVAESHLIFTHIPSNSRFHLIEVDAAYDKTQEAPQIRVQVRNVEKVRELVRECGFDAWIHESVLKRGGGVLETAWGTREYACADPVSNVCVVFYETVV